MNLKLAFTLLIAACVLLVTLMLSIDGNFREYVDDFRQQQTMEVYVNPAATSQQLESLISAIKRLPGYVSFKVQDKEVAFDRMQSLLGEHLLPDDSRNPFPDRIAVRFSADYVSPEAFRAAGSSLQTHSAVDTVTYRGAWLAAQEQAFARWNYIILGTLGFTILAGFLALVMSLSFAEEHNRSMMLALKTHGAGLGLLTRKLIGRWGILVIVAVGLGVGTAWLIWSLVKSHFASELFVSPQQLFILAGVTIGLALLGLFTRLLHYR